MISKEIYFIVFEAIQRIETKYAFATNKDHKHLNVTNTNQIVEHQPETCSSCATRVKKTHVLFNYEISESFNVL
jgi:hypothetical protein